MKAFPTSKAYQCGYVADNPNAIMTPLQLDAMERNEEARKRVEMQKAKLNGDKIYPFSSLNAHQKTSSILNLLKFENRPMKRSEISKALNASKDRFVQYIYKMSAKGLVESYRKIGKDGSLSQSYYQTYKGCEVDPTKFERVDYD